jgi:hypothetical protein
MTVEDIYKTIDVIVKAQQKARRNNDYLTLMLNAEALLEYIPGLIQYSVEKESAYRKYEAQLANGCTDNKRNTSSYSETQAKATEDYSEWTKAKQFIELMYEMVNMAKKLAGGVDKELNASIK